MVAGHSQPLAPRAQKASWSYLQAADTTKMDRSMNWMTCKLEVEGPVFQPEGSSWPRDSWVLGHWACSPSSGSTGTFRNVAWPVWPVHPSRQIIGPWSLLTLDTVLPSWEENEHDSWATAYQRNRERMGRPGSSEKWKPLAIEIFISEDLTNWTETPS